jgi:hypothetical protein
MDDHCHLLGTDRPKPVFQAGRGDVRDDDEKVCTCSGPKTVKTAGNDVVTTAAFGSANNWRAWLGQVFWWL